MRSEPIRILLVEDNVADVYLFRKALLGANLDFELTIFEDGAEALAFVAAKESTLTIRYHTLPFWTSIYRRTMAFKCSKRCARVSDTRKFQ